MTHPMSADNSPVNDNRRRIRWYVIGFVLCLLAGAALWFATRPSPARQFQQGLEALASGDLARVKVLARVLANRPGFESHAHLLNGAVFLRRDQPVESLDEFRKALDHEQTRAQAQVLAGEALARLKQSLQATDVLRQALAVDPDNVEAHRWASIAYYDLGAMEPAVHHLERLAELDSDDPRPHRTLGLIYKDLENDQRAVNCYQESLRRSVNQPDVDSIRTELAEVQIRLNRHADAKATLGQCQPSARVLALRAECEDALGNKTAASALLAAALQRDEREPAALMLQGTIALNNGQPQQAAAAFQQVVGLNPMDFTARFKLSQAYAQQGDQERAAAELTAMNEIKEIRREATEMYQQALRDPRDAESRFRLGVLSEKLRRPDLARMWYQATLSINSDHAPAKAALNKL